MVDALACIFFDLRDGASAEWLLCDEAESHGPGEREVEPCEERELRLRGEPDDWAERLAAGLLERDDEPPGERVRERRREPLVERERDREGTETADEAAECDLERLRLLGGVRESERDLERLGDRLLKNITTIRISHTLEQNLSLSSVQRKICPIYRPFGILKLDS